MEIITSKLGEQGIFVSGNKYNYIEWAEYKGKTFRVGTKVDWCDPDDNNRRYRGKIRWLILLGNGNVEIDFNDKLGRVSLKDLDL